MIIDSHTHIFPDELAEKAINTLNQNTDNRFVPYHNGTKTDLINSMNTAGIDKSIICPISTKPNQVPVINDWIISIKDDRIIPLGTLHPEYENIDDELEKLRANNISGIKLHPLYQNFDINNNKMMKLYHKIYEYNFFILFHSGGDIAFKDNDNANPINFINVITQLPKLNIILAHMGGWNKWDEVIKYIPALDNVFFDTSFSLNYMSKETLIQFKKKFGYKKILFGTDSPWQDQKYSLELIMKMFNANELDNILYKNSDYFFSII